VRGTMSLINLLNYYIISSAYGIGIRTHNL
jgi:hypothetical protein